VEALHDDVDERDQSEAAAQHEEQADDHGDGHHGHHGADGDDDVVTPPPDGPPAHAGERAAGAGPCPDTAASSRDGGGDAACRGEGDAECEGGGETADPRGDGAADDCGDDGPERVASGRVGSGGGRMVNGGDSVGNGDGRERSGDDQAWMSGGWIGGMTGGVCCDLAARDDGWRASGVGEQVRGSDGQMKGGGEQVSEGAGGWSRRVCQVQCTSGTCRRKVSEDFLKI